MYCIEPTVFITAAVVIVSPLLTYLAYMYWIDKDIVTEKVVSASTEDMVEIPPKYIHFHKLISVLNKEYLPNWCKEQHITWTGLICDILEWMQNEGHPNYYDFDTSIKILLNNIDDDGFISDDTIEKIEYQQAFLWVSVAIRIWDSEPREYMPHVWFVIDNVSEEAIKEATEEVTPISKE